MPWSVTEIAPDHVVELQDASTNSHETQTSTPAISR
jgi:hypothetical protein